MKEFIRVMKALSDPNRVRAIKMLGGRDLCVCEITAILGLAQPTVYKHLKVLEDAGLVESWKQGSWVNYRLVDPKAASPYVVTMLEHMEEWLRDDPQVAEDLVQVKRVDRVRICAA